jgi:hypothetical protein
VSSKDGFGLDKRQHATVGCRESCTSSEQHARKREDFLAASLLLISERGSLRIPWAPVLAGPGAIGAPGPSMGHPPAGSLRSGFVGGIAVLAFGFVSAT